MTDLADREAIDRLARDNARLYDDNAELRRQTEELQQLLDEAYRCIPTDDADQFRVDL